MIHIEIATIRLKFSFWIGTKWTNLGFGDAQIYNQNTYQNIPNLTRHRTMSCRDSRPMPQGICVIAE